MSWIKVYAPATIANLGPGFDVIGCAVKEPHGDYVLARKCNTPGVDIIQITGALSLPTDPKQNIASYATLETLAKYNISTGIEMKLIKNPKVLPGSGLGSSASSAAAGAFATALLCDERLQHKELVDNVKHELIVICAKAEGLGITFNAHADNVASALLGGFVLVNHGKAMPLGTIDDLSLIIFSPYKRYNLKTNEYEPYSVRTAQSRAVLPERVKLQDAASNIGYFGQLVYSIIVNDAKLFGASLEDKLVEPVRAKELMPWYFDARKAALDAGALGCTFAGSGPSFFVVAPTNSVIMRSVIIDAVTNALTKAQVIAHVSITKIDTEGTRKVPV